MVGRPRRPFRLSASGVRENNIARDASIYAGALHQEANGDCTCVDHYYQAAVLAWDGAVGNDSTADSRRSRQIYHSALTRLIESGQVHQRLFPSTSLTIGSGPDQFQIPILQRGFPWRPAEIDRLDFVGEYTSPNVKHTYRNDGIGVPVAAIGRARPGDRFQPQRRLYAATVVLRRTNPLNSAARLSVLEINDALRVPTVESSRRLLLPMHRDITSPIAFALKNQHTNFMSDFLYGSDNTDNPGLTMLEPYQPGDFFSNRRAGDSAARTRAHSRQPEYVSFGIHKTHPYQHRPTRSIKPTTEIIRTLTDVTSR